MRVFDASSIVYAWDNYPPNQFVPLWGWLAEQVDTHELVMPKIAFDEVAVVSPDCHAWLKDNDIQLIEISNDIVQEAVRIKGLLGIVNDQYNPKGVGENDLLIIATARIKNLPLISNEEKQNNLPKKLEKRKIPAVCDMNTVNITCIDFLKFIKDSGTVFG